MKTELSRLMERDYGLKGNPFIDTTAREKWLKTWVDREEQLRTWKDIMTKSISTEKNYLVFIIGDYGRGKTLSLLKIISEVQASEYGNKIFGLHMNFREEQKPKTPGADFILRIFRAIDFDELKKRTSNLRAGIDSIPDSYREVREILRKVYSKNAEETELALAFLRGEIRPTQPQMRKLGIIRKLDNVDIAKEYLAGTLRFLKRSGCAALLLAIDEFENLFSIVPPGQQSTYIALLRSLIDLPVGLSKPIDELSNLVLFIAVSDSGMRSMDRADKREAVTGGPTRPLLDRISARTYLGNFDRQQTRELIERRLRYDRISDKYRDRPLIPFTEDFVDLVFETTTGMIRRIIIACGTVLDFGLENGATELNKEFAVKAFDARGWP